MTSKHADFAARFKILRQRKGWSITRTAYECGVDHAAVTRWDQGKTKPRDLHSFCAAFGTTPAEFYSLRIKRSA